MTNTGFTKYKGGHVYILDNPSEPEDISGYTTHSVHDQHNSNVAKFFRRRSPYEVHKVTFPDDSEPGVVLEYFETELAAKTSKEIVIIYFHGIGAHNGKKYTWRFLHSPEQEVNAYKIIQAIIKSGVDCLLLLDCLIPDRFHHKWKAGAGNVEIIATGQPMQGSDGLALAYDPYNFTSSLVNMMDKFIKLISTDYGKQHSPKTIPGLLAMKPLRKKMHFNPRRIWINKPTNAKKEDGRIVNRFVMLPDHIRKAKKVQFFLKTTQGGGSDAGDHESITSDDEVVHDSSHGNGQQVVGLKAGGRGEDESQDGELDDDEALDMTDPVDPGEASLFVSPGPETDDDLA